jgi:hypothetical protein
MGQYNRRIGGIGLREKTLLVFRMGSAQTVNENRCQYLAVRPFGKLRAGSQRHRQVNGYLAG